MTTHWRQRLWYRPVRPRHHWPRWAAIGLVAVALVMLLGGCSGTRVVAEGKVCGQDFKLQLADYKDRGDFSFSAECQGGGSMAMASTESLTSPVAEINAQVTKDLADLIGRMLDLASPVP